MSDSQRRPANMPTVLRRLLGRQGPELTCEQCFELLDEYVELGHAGMAAEELIPKMSAHLEGCAACSEEHDSLLELLQSDRRA